MWMIIGGFLVFFMQAGFALVETGFTRNKNVTHTMMMNMMVFCIGAVGYWLTGFAFQFGGVNAAYPAVTTAGAIAGEWAHSPITLGDWSGFAGDTFAALRSIWNSRRQRFHACGYSGNRIWYSLPSSCSKWSSWIRLPPSQPARWLNA